MAPTRTVRGEVVLPADGLPAAPADVTVFVEDVSRADAPSRVVGRQTLTAIALRPGQTIPFAVDVPADGIDDRHSYSVRVHVDATRSGDLTSGDLVSTESYPVLSAGAPDTARVRVRRV